MHYRYLFATSIATVVLALSSLAPASATTRQTGANASGRCQSALPAFEGAIRKRPLALQNEGTSAAFVTCSYVVDGSDVSTVGGINLYARSVNGQASTLSCTAVVGFDTSPAVFYIAKSIPLTADGEQSSISFSGPSDFPNGVNPYSPLSLTCALPVGAALNDMYYTYGDGYATPTATTIPTD